MIKNFKGFTLVELIIVILILIIIAGGVIYLSPRLIIRQRLKNNAWQILNDLKEVQIRARAQLERLRIEFDINNGTYRFEKRKGAFEGESSENVVYKKLDSKINFNSIRIGNTTYGTGIASYMYDEWGVPKKVDNTDPGEILIIIETPSLKNREGQNLSVEISVSPGSGTLRMVGPK